MSLRMRLTTLTVVLTSSILLIFALVFYVVLQDKLFEELDRRLYERAALVKRMLNADADAEAGRAYVPLLVEFDAPGIYVELIAPDGTVRVSSPSLDRGRLPTDPAMDANARMGQSSIDTIWAGGDEELRLLVTPAQPDGVLVVAESLEPIERTLGQTRALLLACGGVTLALATCGVAVLTGRALAPIGLLTRAAATIAADGRYHARVPASGRRDEVGQLAATINELIATVERTLRQQRQFLADTSHELRSPLTVVLANLNLLQRTLDPHEYALSVGEAMAESQRMRRLINDLLLLARGDAGQAPAMVPLQLDQLVQESVVIAVRQNPACPITVQVDQTVIMGDQEQITQVLRNLLENAIRHTPPGTAITVRLRRLDDAADLSVTDTGPGIAAEHLAHVWDRFYSVNKARSRALGGTGLGLAIVKHITEAHGGNVCAASVQGRGTTFTLRLPLAQPTWQPDQTAAAAVA